MKKMIEHFEWMVVILVVSVLMACATITPIDNDAAAEKSCATLHCHIRSHRRFGGMYDLARKTRKKVDDAVYERARCELRSNTEKRLMEELPWD
ncbi:MAG: hypothetical protein LBK83_14260 [Treponema sp.]|nr:hypothetical protein [Treponema sp.]